MSGENRLDEIREVVLTLVEKDCDQPTIEKGLREVHAHFEALTEISGFDQELTHLAAVNTSKGRALGLNHAAKCLLDFNRTVKFLKAMVKAIRTKQSEHPGASINVLYAGCGPYAPFVTLVAPLFSAEEVQFDVLDVNEKSIVSAKRLIEGLALTDYVKGYFVADATTFQVPSAEKYHILFSETLDALLYRECYVPILFNLLPQLADDIALIPENVLVSLHVLSLPITDPNHVETMVTDVIDAREAVNAHDGPSIPVQLPDKRVSLGSLDMDNQHSLLFDTRVHVYDDIWLDRSESALSLPLELKFDQPVNEKTLVVTYHMGTSIEMKCSME